LSILARKKYSNHSVLQEGGVVDDDVFLEEKREGRPRLLTDKNPGPALR
jgi:hypothetical protein